MQVLPICHLFTNRIDEGLKDEKNERRGGGEVKKNQKSKLSVLYINTGSVGIGCSPELWHVFNKQFSCVS